MTIRALRGVSALTLAAVMAAPLLAGGAAAQQVTLWSHWADHESKVAFVEEAARRFEAANPGVEVEISWYQKPPLEAALKAALQAGQGPDLFYAEPAQSEYVDNGFLHPLDDAIDWANIEDWAEGPWTRDGQLFGLPLEAATVELYYNTEKMAELGFELPENRQVDAATFKAIVTQAAEAGLTPIVQGVGDRAFPGAYLTHELILKQLGTEDYGKLLAGEIGWSDPRVVGVMNYVEELVEAGAYPRSFSTLKLGESHYYFHTQPGGLMFPMGSWYSSRAFNAPDAGGQPVDFPLGIMRFPALEGAACPDCKTLNVAGSFVVNADSPHPDLAAGLLDVMADPEMGTMWLATVLVQTGIKSDPSQITGQYRDYFEELMTIDNSSTFFVGLPQDHLQGQCLETFVQVINGAFPAGQIGVEEATQMMDMACKA